MYRIPRRECDDMRSAVIDYKGVRGYDQRALWLRQSEPNLGIHSGKKRTVPIVDLDFRPQGSSGVVEGISIPNNRSGVRPADPLPGGNHHCLTIMDIHGFRLRYVNLDSQGTILGDTE